MLIQGNGMDKRIIKEGKIPELIIKSNPNVNQI